MVEKTQQDVVDLLTDVCSFRPILQVIALLVRIISPGAAYSVIQNY